MNIKFVAVVLIVAIVTNLILFALGLLNETVFWALIIVIGIASYKILPKLKKV
jgi:membrane protein YdbS with pleckstrin-like domain